jgi:hypothetical protein
VSSHFLHSIVTQAYVKNGPDWPEVAGSKTARRGTWPTKASPSSRVWQAKCSENGICVTFMHKHEQGFSQDICVQFRSRLTTAFPSQGPERDTKYSHDPNQTNSNKTARTCYLKNIEEKRGMTINAFCYWLRCKNLQCYCVIA